jgi:hypothetical protein
MIFSLYGITIVNTLAILSVFMRIYSSIQHKDWKLVKFQFIRFVNYLPGGMDNETIILLRYREQSYY